MKRKLPKAIAPAAASMTEQRFAPTGTSATRREPTEYDQSKEFAAAATEPRARSLEPQNGASIESTAHTLNTIDRLAAGRDAVAIQLAERFSFLSGIAGLIPLPFVDLAAIGGIQIQMLRRIAQIYGVRFSKNRGKMLIASLAGSLIPATSALGATSMLKNVPIVGAAVGTMAMPALSAGATYAIGIAFIHHFSSGGTLLDFNPRDYRELVRVQYRLRPK